MLFLIVAAVPPLLHQEEDLGAVGGEVEGHATPPMTHNP
jgi:hypothetical protein